MNSSGKLMAMLFGGMLLLLFVGATCNKKGDQGPVGATGAAGPITPPPTNTSLAHYDALPGMVLTINSVTGGTGTAGQFKVGDKPVVNFTIKKSNGQYLPINEVDYLRVMFGGPSFNYQRIIGATNILTTATLQNDNTYNVTLAAIPATYLAPYNDTATYDTTDGELTGQALLSGTYTVAMYGYKNYTLGGNSYRDTADNVTKDVLFGTATTIDTREVVKASNCNQCHVRVQAHGGSRNNSITTCLMCHTSGSEDTNASGATPGVLIDFRNMIHRIHNGKHMPSLNGATVDGTGNRVMTGTPKAVMVATHDYSEVGFPVWPNLNVTLPRNNGYTALTAAQKTADDEIRRGVTNCAVCHGDPDGSGALTAPAQGAQYKSMQSRRACAGCHDDVDYTKNYIKNGQTMPAQANDSNCATCHTASGSALSIDDAHTHPLLNSTVNPGLIFQISGLVEAGTNNGDGTVDAGEKVAVTFKPVAGDGSTAVTPASINSLNIILNGPTNNKQVILYASIPTGSLTGAAPYTINVPEPVMFEYVGTAANDAGLETFNTSRTPTWDALGAAAKIYCRTASGASTTLSAAAPKDQHWVDVASTAGFANNNYCVIEDGTGNREYFQIGYVDTTKNRLIFKANSYAQQSALKKSHALGISVQQVTLTQKTVTTDYTVTAATGAVAEAANASFPAGQAVVVSYTTDFVMPTTYGPSLNDSPDLNENIGEWTGKNIVDGTYTVTIWGYINRVVTSPDALESVTYRGTSEPAMKDFLVGSATTLEPYTNMTKTNCNRCHQDLYFHGGGRRGFDTCIQCHQASGAEDMAKFTTPTAPETPGGSIEFRNMLHKIHRGAELYNAASYSVIGFGGSVNKYDEVEFPVWRDGVKNCGVCHGNNANFHNPTHREHPTQQGVDVKHYTYTCLSCHDAPSAAAHASLMTTAGGSESCAACHSDGKEYDVAVLHKARP